MGVELSKPCDCRVVMVGLDAGGKTTILYRYYFNPDPKKFFKQDRKSKEYNSGLVTTTPTKGFNVETFEYTSGESREKFSFTVWDLGGQEESRPMWSQYYKSTNAIIYVVDSNDRESITEAREELHRLMESDELRNVPVLVLANKQDLPNAMSRDEVIDKLQLSEKANTRQWHVQESCATSAGGIYEGLDWLAMSIKNQNKDL